MMPARHDYRIVLVDDHALFAESLELALSMKGYDVRRIESPDEFGSLPALTTKLLRLKPHIVLLDLHLGRLGDATRLIAPLARDGVNVVVVTAAADRSLWGACVRQGARKVISKSSPLSQTLGVVRRLHVQQQVMAADEREDLLDHWQRHVSRHAGARSRFALLSERERHLLGELMSGRSVREVATTRVVSEGTVRTQVKSILAKLEVSSQLAAVGMAHEVAWTPPQSEAGSSQVSC